MFNSLQLTHDSQEIVFGDSGKGEVLGLGNIPISNDQFISNVLLVDSLSYNLLSVRWVTIVSLRMRVCKSLESRIPLLLLRVA